MLARMGRALVTGGASGIGAACAAVLERDGWEVVRTDLADAAGVHRLDVADEAAWEQSMVELDDALITSAGIRTRSMIMDTSLEDWERHLRVNVTGTWLAIRAFLRQIPTGDPTPRSIVTIASVNATIAVPGQAHYVASKGAITALTRASGLDGAGLGVGAYSIAPGPIRTPMAAERLEDPEQVRWLTGRVPLGRVGEPDEIAELAAFLVSPRSSYLTGEIIYADGGWAANAV